MFRLFSFFMGFIAGAIAASLIARKPSGLRLIRSIGESVLRASNRVTGYASDVANRGVQKRP